MDTRIRRTAVTLLIWAPLALTWFLVIETEPLAIPMQHDLAQCMQKADRLQSDLAVSEEREVVNALMWHQEVDRLREKATRTGSIETGRLEEYQQGRLSKAQSRAEVEAAFRNAVDECNCIFAFALVDKEGFRYYADWLRRKISAKDVIGRQKELEAEILERRQPLHKLFAVKP